MTHISISLEPRRSQRTRRYSFITVIRADYGLYIHFRPKVAVEDPSGLFEILRMLLAFFVVMRMDLWIMHSTGTQGFSREWYRRPTLDVARGLLGAVFVRYLPEATLTGRIVEVEAYHGPTDEASHAFRGRTPRNEAMFHAGGCLYVYFTYGMHYCMNVVTETAGTGAAVLIRAIEPLGGVDLMRRNRGDRIAFHDLTNGPAKCCKAFGVGRAQDGASLLGPEFLILPGESVPDQHVVRSARIGIRRSADLPWRISIKGNPFVSRPKP